MGILIGDFDSVDYMIYEERPYYVKCASCGVVDRGSEGALRRAGWNLSHVAELCPVHADKPIERRRELRVSTRL